MRDHGGNIDEAIAAYGGSREAWIDLSTGINRQAYPLPSINSHTWTDLPTDTQLKALAVAARQAYRTQSDLFAAVLPVAGAQAAIQLIPRLRPVGMARVLGPTYNEHAAALRLQGWDVTEVASLEDLAGADLAVVVNPNNPDGRTHSPDELLALCSQIGLLVVDESFVDSRPELSLAPAAGQSGLLILRSFGKFYGLAGLRLGFACGHAEDINALRAMSGPWSVSGPALEIGATALADNKWQEETTARLKEETQRLDALALAAGWVLVGGTELFRTYNAGDARQTLDTLAHHQIWGRIFPYSAKWVRLGLPGDESEWARLEAALKTIGAAR